MKKILSFFLLISFLLFSCMTREASDDDNNDDNNNNNDQDLVVSSPDIMPDNGNIRVGTVITMHSNTEGSTIYYTTDGSDPTESSNVYNDNSRPSVSSANMIIKARAFKDGYEPSSVSIRNYNTFFYIAGSFTSYNDGEDNSVGYIAKLKGDGTLDSTFNSGGSGFNGTLVNALVTQPGGKIIAAGDFSSYNDGEDHSVGYIARLNQNGSFDATFNPIVSGFDSNVTCLQVINNLNMIVGGNFITYEDGLLSGTIDSIMGLTLDGGIYTAFDPNPGDNAGFGGEVKTLALHIDGKILAVGGFASYYDGSSHNVGYIARLNQDGNLDTSFNPIGSGFNDLVNSIFVLPDGKILVGGAFSDYNDVSPHSVGYIARLNPDGTFDNTFNTLGTGVNNTVTSINLRVY